jgi:hypothetical protein
MFLVALKEKPGGEGAGIEEILIATPTSRPPDRSTELVSGGIQVG